METAIQNIITAAQIIISISLDYTDGYAKPSQAQFELQKGVDYISTQISLIGNKE